MIALLFSSLLFLFSALTALAQTGDCTSSDAPSAYYSNYCDNMCVYNSGAKSWTCSLETICSSTGGELWVVGRYGSSTREYSAWAVCYDSGPNRSCCTYNEGTGTEVDVVYANGTAHYDRINFWDYGTSEYLEPTSGRDLAGVAQGLGGSDDLLGSDYPDADYDEFLLGGVGSDWMYGYGGRDKMWGGDGDDVMVGGDGPDYMYGEAGDDVYYGNDLMCDDTGQSVFGCASSGGHLFMGGDGNDTIWYPILHSSCATNVAMSTDSDAGNGSDTCGDHNDWTEDDTVDWPDYCESPSEVVPDRCGDSCPWL